MKDLSLLGKRQLQESSIKPMVHISGLRKEVPKPLPTQSPKLEDDFLLKSKKKPMDDLALQRKTKQAEKEAIKEFKKDNTVIQRQKQLENFQRKAVAKRSTFRVGSSLKDEI